MAVEKTDREALSGPKLRGVLIRWLLPILLWTAIGFLFALPDLAKDDWRITLCTSLAQWWSWGIVSPLIFWIDDRLPFSERQLVKRISAQLLPSFALTALYLYVFTSALALLQLGPWNAVADISLLTKSFSDGVLWMWLIYWLIFGARQTYRYHEHYVASELRLERMERSFAEARLNGLRMQLAPHFLFNALNTISSQTERDPKLARNMIGHLGDLLRLSLASHERQQVPLAEEVVFLEHYIAIQKIRFGGSLRIEISFSSDLGNALVPSLILQPLVENAIHHGIAPCAREGTITVSAHKVAETLFLCVSDDGVGLPQAGRSIPASASGSLLHVNV